ILLTTPESLAVLLTQPDSARLFANLARVVVDEVHALAPNKRGADLALSLERLVALAGAVRRIGLSATALPLDLAARWLAGVGRACAVVCAGPAEPPRFRIEPLPPDTRMLASLLDRLGRELPAHRAVLVFTNTRALAERVGWNLRRRLPALAEGIAVHHSA